MENEQTKKFIITHELAQGVLNYLQQRPYAEVAGLIAGLVQIEALPEFVQSIQAEELSANGGIPVAGKKQQIVKADA